MYGVGKNKFAIILESLTTGGADPSFLLLHLFSGQSWIPDLFVEIKGSFSMYYKSF